MAAIKIRDSLELLDYLKGMAGRVEAITDVVYVDSGIDLKDFMNEYYGQATDEECACVLFVELNEMPLGTDSNKGNIEYVGLLAVLTSIEDGDKSAEAILRARDTSVKALSRVFGLWEKDSEDNRREDTENWWELKREDRTLRPTSEKGNRNAWGVIGGFELWTEAGKIIYGT